ncbi:MAG: hypothetical protein ABSA57_08910 [Candidatus Acidiferrales bacterium]|jgi:hypothetical protein
MRNEAVRGMMFSVACFLVLASSIRVAGQSKPSGNFVKDVLDHKGEIQWITYKTPTLPDDVCTLLSACTGPAAKVAALPPATIRGRKVGRALFLTEVKKQPTIILEHQIPNSEVYFFQLGPDGSLQKTAYLEQGKTFLVIANSLAQPIFQADIKDWQAWVARPGPAKEN